jgi:hypothetical protein
VLIRVNSCEQMLISPSRIKIRAKICVHVNGG